MYFNYFSVLLIKIIKNKIQIRRYIKLENKYKKIMTRFYPDISVEVCH